MDDGEGDERTEKETDIPNAALINNEQGETEAGNVNGGQEKEQGEKETGECMDDNEGGDGANRRADSDEGDDVVQETGIIEDDITFRAEEADGEKTQSRGENDGRDGDGREKSGEEMEQTDPGGEREGEPLESIIMADASSSADAKDSGGQELPDGTGEVPQPGTSQEVPHTEASVMEQLTLGEAREKIGVLEERLEREETLRQSAEKHNAVLKQRVEQLNQEVHNLRRSGHVAMETQEIGVQTEPECIQIPDEQPSNQAEVYQVGEGSSSTQPTASSSSAHSDWSTRTTGQNNHLYYEPSRGIYYYYDDQSQSYQYHSRVEVPEAVATATGSGKNQSGGRRHDREQRKGDKSRRRIRGEQNRDESSTNDRPSTSTTDVYYEVIDITSPNEDYPENGIDSTTTATATATATTQENRDRGGDGNDVVEIVDEDDASRHRRRRRRKSSSSRKRRKLGSEEEKREDGDELPDVIVIDSDESDLEEGELSSSSSESRTGWSRLDSGEDPQGSESEESMVIDDDEDDDDDDVHSVEATKVDYPPCIRMIVVRSESMKLGSLAVVTCTGGSIGREGSCHILLVPELGVSKTHAQISYDREMATYTITDLGSQNGTVLNGVPLTQKSRVKSDPQPLGHKDYLTFGTTTLRIHIHRGDETCEECEPGQVQAMFRQQQSLEVSASSLSPGDKEQQRRRELRKLKKKYLLAGAGAREPPRSKTQYKDRAEERRVTVGSDNPHQPDDLPASVDRAISDNNMGHKMLKKMGWKEGESLGATDTGIKEPIQVFIHSKKAGLGASGQKSIDTLEMLGRRKSEHWNRARDRFQQLDQGASKQSNRPQPMTWVRGSAQSDADVLLDGRDEPARNDVEMVHDLVSAEDVGMDGGQNTQNCHVRPLHVEVQRSENGEEPEKDGASVTDRTIEGGLEYDEMVDDELCVEEPAVCGEAKIVSTTAEDVEKAQNNASPEVGSESGELQRPSEKAVSGRSSPVNAQSTHDRPEVQPSTDGTQERGGAKKPIKFVIPPRMNTKLGGRKSPLAAPTPTLENNAADGASTRRTRQSSRRNKDRTDQIDMFDNG